MADIKTTLDNIISHWELEETSGTRVDSTASGNDLTDNNTVLSAVGIQGTAADIELSNSESLSITDASQTGLDITTDFSISAWVKLEQLPSTAGSTFSILVKDDVATQRAYDLEITTSDKLFLFYFASSSVLTDSGSSSAFFVSGDVGNWVHLVVTVDISAKSILLYKNGSSVSVTPNNAGATTINNTSALFQIGARNSSNYYDGLIDEVTVTSDIITSGEVTTIYNSGSGIPYESAATPANLKTWDTVATASVKTRNTVAKASIKTANTIS